MFKRAFYFTNSITYLQTTDSALVKSKAAIFSRKFEEIMATEVAVDHANVLLSELAIVGGTDFFSATLKSLIVILVTEIGDKTFFIAAVRSAPLKHCIINSSFNI